MSDDAIAATAIHETSKIEMDEQCTHCEGTGDDGNGDRSCWRCEGTGNLRLELSEYILRVIRGVIKL